jgi:hypothetical protein
MSWPMRGTTIVLQDREPRSVITHESHLNHQDHQQNPPHFLVVKMKAHEDAIHTIKKEEEEVGN